MMARKFGKINLTEAHCVHSLSSVYLDNYLVRSVWVGFKGCSCLSGGHPCPGDANRVW